MRTGRILGRTIIFCLIFSIFPDQAEAGGSRDLSGEYEQKLIENFSLLIKDLSISRISADQAKAELEELREEYKQEYNDLSGIMDALIDRVAEKKVSFEEAVEYFESVIEKRTGSHDTAESKGSEKDGARQGSGNGGNGQGSGDSGGKGSR